MRQPVAVLISGSGTNLQALIDAASAPDYPAEIRVVISNRRDAFGLQRARDAGIEALWIPHRGRSRAAFEAELLEALSERSVSWVALAGFMRLLSEAFLSAYAGRILNIHPALLPAFPGVRGARQAVEYGVRIAGATVHFVDAGTDTGPIILQGAVPVLPDDDDDTLAARILTIEHQLYPRALALATSGQLRIEGRRVGLPDGEPGLLWSR
ncbi:MAG: phosphoribosylglycinamide formyltransferase [Myxococcota bacterium]|nr:phosphoribosylglycinamide formyltransferase [Myxococcota bacterium]